MPSSSNIAWSFTPCATASRAPTGVTWTRLDLASVQLSGQSLVLHTMRHGIPRANRRDLDPLPTLLTLRQLDELTLLT